MLRIAIICALFACAFGAVPRLQPLLPDHRIVGGENADIRDFPHQLSFRNSGSHSCGASIISSKWVLTAAHCVENSLTGFSVSAGSTNRKNGTLYFFKRVITHPKYKAWTLNFDYALLEVDGEIEFGPTVQPIALAEKEPEDDELVTVTGWGTTYPGGSATLNLMKVAVRIINRDVCEVFYLRVNPVTENMICAGYLEGRKDACQGDSGGPLIANNILYGIVSWGLGCAQANHPGVYSNIVTARSWIKEVSGV